MSDERPTPDVTGRPRPGSAGWAAAIQELRDIEPSPRRAALFRVADAIRDVLHRMVQTSAPNEVIEAAAADVEAAAERFAPYTNKSMYEGFAESANAGEPFGFFDHSPMLGQANPLAPPIQLWLEGDRIRGHRHVRRRLRGPARAACTAATSRRPSTRCSGSTQSLSGSPGMTGRLTVHYRKPTPLETELRFVGWIESVEGRKILTKGELWAGDLLCAEAEGLFISIEPGKFADLRPSATGARRGSSRRRLGRATNASTTGTSSTRCSLRPDTIAPSTAPATSSAFTLQRRPRRAGGSRRRSASNR